MYTNFCILELYTEHGHLNDRKMRNKVDKGKKQRNLLPVHIHRKF